MKKICFLILMLVGVSAKSNALQFSELCELFNNNASANMTINFDNGTSIPISASSMMEICQEQNSNNPWISDPVTNFSLAMIGATTAVTIPCLQFIGGYVYNRWCRGQSVEERLLTEIDARTTATNNKLNVIEPSTNLIPEVNERVINASSGLNDKLDDIGNRLGAIESRLLNQ